MRKLDLIIFPGIKRLGGAVVGCCMLAAFSGHSMQATGQNTLPKSSAASYSAKSDTNAAAAPKTPVQSGVRISPDVAKLVNMADSGVDASVIKAYIESSNILAAPTPDEIIYLHQHGLSSEVITALIRRSAELRREIAQPQPAIPQQPTSPPPSVYPMSIPYPVYSGYPSYAYPSYVPSYYYYYRYRNYGYSPYYWWSFSPFFFSSRVSFASHRFHTFPQNRTVSHVNFVSRQGGISAFGPPGGFRGGSHAGFSRGGISPGGMAHSGGFNGGSHGGMSHR